MTNFINRYLQLSLSRSSWGVVLLGVAATAAGFMVTQRGVEREVRTQFANQASRLHSLFEHEIEERLDLLLQSQARIKSPPEITPEQFARFIADQRSGELAKGVEWFAQVRHVPGALKREYERALGRALNESRGGGVAITPPGDRRDYYVFDIPPPGPGKILLGLDLGAYASNRQALEKARSSGQMVITRLTGLDDEHSSRRAAIVPVDLRVDNGGKAGPQGQPYARFLLVRFDFSTLVRTMFHDQLPVGYRLIFTDEGDQANGPGGALLFDSGYSGSAKSTVHRPYIARKQVRFGDRQLDVSVLADPANVVATDAWLPWVVLGFGVLATLAVLLKVGQLRTAEARAKLLADEMAQRYRASEQRFRDLVESGNEWIWETDANGFYTYVSPNSERLLGYRPEEIVATEGAFLWASPDDRPAARAARSAPREQRTMMERVARHKTGRNVIMESSVVSVIGLNGEFSGERGFDRDVTERKRLASQLQLLEQRIATLSRVETVNQAMAGMAHELNQPLAAIATYNQASLRMLNATPFPAAEIANAMQATARHAHVAGDIVRRFRDFFETPRMQVAPVQVKAVVANALDLVRHRVETESIQVSLDIPERLPSIEADELFLTQALVNLLANAIDAMQSSQERTLTVAACLLNDEMVEIGVTDTGRGIDAGLANKVFDPYYTTKEKGIGLGLAITRSIVEAHEGEIGLRSNSNGGCTFWIRIPLWLAR